MSKNTKSEVVEETKVTEQEVAETKVEEPKKEEPQKRSIREKVGEALVSAGTKLTTKPEKKEVTSEKPKWGWKKKVAVGSVVVGGVSALAYGVAKAFSGDDDKSSSNDDSDTFEAVWTETYVSEDNSNESVETYTEEV